MKSYLNPPKKVDIIPPPVITDPNFDDFVVFDIETTGLSRTEEIIEIGAIRVRGGKGTEKFSSLVRPKKSVPYLIQEITGITNIMLSNAPKIDEVLPSFLDFIGEDILLGHNIVSFDSKFICREAAEIGINLKNPLFDTLTYAKRLKKRTAMPESLSLTSLCSAFGIKNDSAHRAYDDALANAKVFYLLRAIEKKIEAE
ncbi:MAG: 3'-5' exonuclease [Clostridia bacterium]|nr:3'-5' exonuclease [Clostridia bacterium]